MKFKSIISILCILLIIGGCSKKAITSLDIPADTSISTSFQDKNITAYVNNEPVYLDKEEQFIDMKKEFMQKIVDAGSEGNFNYNNPYNNLVIKETAVVEKIHYDINYQRAETYLSLSEEEKMRDYYKTYLIMQELYSSNPQYEKTINSEVENAAESLLENNLTLPLDYYSTIDVNTIINDISKKYNISYQDCVENIFKPFWTYYSSDYDRVENYMKTKYQGTKVNYNGTNDDEFRAYVIDVYKQYDEHTDDLINKANIVEKH